MRTLIAILVIGAVVQLYSDVIFSHLRLLLLGLAI